MGLDAAIIGMLNKLVNQPAAEQQREAWHIHHRGQPQWTDAGAKANMPGVKGIAATGAKASDGKIHVYLGTDWAGGNLTATGDHYAYDPATNTWANLARAPHELITYAGETLQGKPYYATGDRGYPNFGSYAAYAACYDPATNTWTTLANHPGDRNRASATATDTEFHVSGGATNSSFATDTWYAYNPTTNTWTSKGTLPVKLAYHAFAYDPSTGYFYLTLGMKGPYSNNTQSWYYNGTAWIAIANAPGTGTEVSAYAGDGTLITIPAGGTSAFVYDSITNTWATYAVDYRSYTQTGYYRDEQGKWHLYRFGGKDVANQPTTTTREYIYSMQPVEGTYTKEFAGVCILSVSYVNTATDIQITITDEFGKTYNATVNATLQTPHQLGIYSQPTVQVGFTDEGEIIIIQT